MRENNFICSYCKKEDYRKPSKLNKNNNNFCCLGCSHKFKDKRVEVICQVCQKIFLKERCEISRRSRHCCSKECSIILGKKYKDWSSSRSKLEIAIEAHLTKVSTLKIDYNKTEIGYELDIYIPILSLAFELNGPLHYRPIFGMKKLLRVQQIDAEKVIECKERNIKLIVIDVSKDKRSKKVENQRIQEVVKIIADRIQELNYDIDQIQTLMNF